MSITNVTGDNYGRFQGNPTIANIAIIGQSFQFRKTPYIGYILYVTQHTCFDFFNSLILSYLHISLNFSRRDIHIYGRESCNK